MPIRIPQVREQGLPQTSGVRTPGADAFGAQVAGATGQLGRAIGEIALDIQNTRNTTQAREADTWYKNRLSELRTSYETRQGKDAFETNNEYLSAIDKAKEEASGMLQNAAQKRMFMPSADSAANSTKAAGRQYALSALKTWESNELKSSAAIHTEQYLRDYGGPNGANARQAMHEALEDIADNTGLGPEARTQMHIDAESSAIRKVIESKADKSPFVALSILKAENENLTVADRTAVEGVVKGHTDKARALSAARSIYAESGGDPRAAREALKKLPADIYATAKVEVEYQISAAEATKRFEQAEVVDANWDVVLADPVPANLPKEGTIPDDDWRSMESYILAKAKNTEPNNNWNAWTDLQEAPYEQLITINPKSLRGHLDDAHYVKAVNLIEKAKREGPEWDNENRTTPAQYRQRGRDLAKIKTSEKENAAKFDTGLDAAWRAKERELKRKLSDSEQQAVVNNYVYNYNRDVIVGKSWFGMANATERLSTFEFKNSKGVPYTQLNIREAADALEKNKSPVTEANIQYMLNKVFEPK